MPFGRRGTNSQSGRTAKDSANRRELLRASPLWGQLGGLLAGFLIAVVVVTAGGISMKIMGRSMEQSMKARFEGGPVQVQIANRAVSNAPSDTALSSSCPAPTFRSRLNLRLPYVTGFDRAAIEEGEMADQMGQHVNCIMLFDRRRFCERKARLQLAERMNAYLKMRRKAGQLIGSNDRVAQVGRAMWMAPGWRERMDDATFRAIRTLYVVDPELIENLKLLVEAGYLSASDFGGPLGLFIPSELEQHISNIKPNGSPCK